MAFLEINRALKYKVCGYFAGIVGAKRNTTGGKRNARSDGFTQKIRTEEAACRD